MRHRKSETINKITLDSKDLCKYAYLGMSIAVTTRYRNLATTPATVAEQNFATGGTGAGRYAGFDRFGRIIETLWKDGSSTTLQNARYGYNQASNRIWREDLLAAGKGLDNFYWYDDLYQVTAREQGTLDGTFPDYTGIANPPTEEEDFCYDETGNWLKYDNKGMAGPDPLHQQRQHNKANEITSITNPSTVIQPTYDSAGNMTKLPQPGDWTKGYNVTWDGWNRIVELKESATSATVARYAYDGLTRRITADTGESTEVRHSYYNRQWRCVEEYLNDAADADPDRRYAWGAQSRWQMILRQRSDAGTLDENLYALYDAMDPMAVVNPGGVVKERYAYSAFRETTILNADFTQRTAGSDYGWNLLFHLEFRDDETGLYNYGYRSYHPELGRWLSRDPIGENGGVTLFAFIDNSPNGHRDFIGLAKTDFTDEANVSLGPLKKCGCYDLTGSFSKYNIFDRKDEDFQVGGADVNLDLTAKSNDPKECCCSAVKVLQIVRTSQKDSNGKPPAPTYRNSRIGKFYGWRIDAIKGQGEGEGVHQVSPFYSDNPGLGSAIGNTGSIKDTPGIYKWLYELNAMTCLICQKSTKPSEIGKTLGCISWGFSVSVKDGVRTTTLKPTSFLCAGDKEPSGKTTVNSAIEDAADQWDSLNDETTESEKWQFDNQLRLPQ